MREKYPKARITKSRRGLLVEYNEPVTTEEDPSVDLIVTLTRKDADGLWIPDREATEEMKKWTPSHPERHTELFTSGTKELRVLRARVARMAKAWNGQWDEGDRGLSSFNIAALAWEDVTDSSVPLDTALAHLFRYARDELDKAKTKDPAGSPTRFACCATRTRWSGDSARRRTLWTRPSRTRTTRTKCAERCAASTPTT